jgi:predicted HTH domain antitoxin
MARTVSGRLPPDLVRELDHLGKLAGKTRSEILRDVVRRGVAAERLDRALQAYRRRQVSLGRASELAGVPVTVFIDELRGAGILRHYGADELRRDLEWAKPG